jgi:hypothetical protein
MEFFVRKDSIVREIWGKSDTILFIFAGASAEFALNKAVDWLYFTGRLPADPLGRLFSTVGYARQIVFSSTEDAHRAIDRMSAIHGGVEAARGSKIPDWAYRDVLFMLIDYSIRSYEVLERKLTEAEKEEVFDVFNRVGLRMNLVGLPTAYREWLRMRDEHLENDLVKSEYSVDLFRQYRKHLGYVRYRLLIGAQGLVTPPIVNQLLGLGNQLVLPPLLTAYKISRRIKTEWILKELILPPAYKAEIRGLDAYGA